MAGANPKPAEWQKLFDWAERLLGTEVPGFIKIPLGVLVLVGIVVAIMAGILIAVGKIKDVWEARLRPATYSPEQKQKALARRQFAQHLVHEIVVRNRAENWRDQQFAELEAEVEAEGEAVTLLPFIPSFGRSSVRRERSLTVLALAYSSRISDAATNVVSKDSPGRII